jgi:anti-sigma B factor antagonist
MRLKTETRLDGPVGIVTVAGELDLATVPTLRDTLTDVLGAGSHELVLDLSNVPFIDSTGLGVIMGTAKKARAAGGSLSLVCDNPRILRVLTLTGFATVLPIHATLTEAVPAPLSSPLSSIG